MLAKVDSDASPTPRRALAIRSIPTMVMFEQRRRGQAPVGRVQAPQIVAWAKAA